MNPAAIKPGTILAAVIVLSGYIYVVTERMKEFPNALHGFGFHPEAITGAPRAIQIHLAAALLAIMIGVVQMTAAKGSRQHRIVGWIWALSAIFMSAAAFFINEKIGPLQILAVVVILLTARAVWLARRGDVARHSQQMRMLFFGAMLAVGLFTAVPGRVTWNLFFQP
jgi:uncharacterized membrane protein